LEVDDDDDLPVAQDEGTDEEKESLKATMTNLARMVPCQVPMPWQLANSRPV
jgi:hypothetical protein